MGNNVFILPIIFLLYHNNAGLICNNGTVFECTCFRECETKEEEDKMCEDLIDDGYLRTVYLMGSIKRNQQIEEYHIRKKLAQFLTEKCITNPKICGEPEMNITADRVTIVKIFIGKTEVRINFAVSKLSNNLLLTKENTMDVNGILTLFSMNIYGYSDILAPQINIRHTSGNYFQPGVKYCKKDEKISKEKKKKNNILGTVLVIITIFVVFSLIIVNCLILIGRC